MSEQQLYEVISILQHGLLATGVLLSFLLWLFTWKRIKGIWSISWRTAVTILLTADTLWPGLADSDYELLLQLSMYFDGRGPEHVLYWTMMLIGNNRLGDHFPYATLAFASIATYWIVLTITAVTVLALYRRADQLYGNAIKK